MSVDNRFRNPNDENLTIRDHQDPDKHWIGETLPAPTQGDIPGTVGTLSGVGDSPFPARADHLHKLDGSFFPRSINASPGSLIAATTSASFVTWLTSNTFTVPDWATSALVHVDITNIYTLTAVATYTLCATISGGAYAGDAAGFTTPAVSERSSTSLSLVVSGFTPGAGKAVLIGARRTSGTGVLNADTSSKVTGFVQFIAY